MSTLQSLRLEDAAPLDSMESGDISLDCLSQKCLSHCRKKKKNSKIGQQNPVGGMSDKARFFTVSLVAVKGEDKQSEEYLELSVQATGGRLRNILTYESA